MRMAALVGRGFPRSVTVRHTTICETPQGGCVVLNIATADAHGA